MMNRVKGAQLHRCGQIFIDIAKQWIARTPIVGLALPLFLMIYWVQSETAS